MDKFKLIEALLEDAQKENEYFKEYQEIYKEARNAEYDSPAYCKWRRARCPSKKRIEDDLTMIRRIALDIRKELLG